MKFCACSLIALAVAKVGNAGDEHERASCACEAQEHGFAIDCTNGDAMLAALAGLQADACDSDCSSEECRKNFLLIQSHHDFCLHAEVPEPVETSFHNYEGVCGECSIIKKHDPTLDNCPAAQCDNRGNEAFSGLLTNGCLINCATSVCANHYRILRAEHDMCDHDTLSTDAETGIHDFEEVCSEFNCNLLTDADASNAQLICREPRTSSSSTMMRVGELMIVSFASLSAMLV